MKKEILESFLKRSTLNGLIPRVKWKYTILDKTLHTRSTIDNKSFMSDVVMSDFTDFGSDDLTICIGDTEKVKSMISPLGDDINISVNRNGDRILGIDISDMDCQCYCSAADPSIIDPVPKTLSDLPDYDVIIPLTDEFIAKFLRARSALREVDSFSVGMNKAKVLEVVIGNITSNANRIRITPVTDAVKNTLRQSVTFPIKNVIETLKVNADIPGGTLSINGEGIIKIYFKNDKFQITYFQFSNKTK